ncbi:TonB-dependent receptor [Tahibacter soli]|jgi:iron complex outermembrane receptor protein|uniref:TonB-dependent receptor n=1 Tax=Tahibacter soli TaxID=2983605 RepID=A0A9X3YRE0_9GAMM|nr:TonB-dependent receptor [Tahibacter soli]MDC8016130.1 TonB-dependent receptor [Tahibacter soli]
MKYSHSALYCAIVAVLVSGPASAADADAEPSQALDTINVTATKRETPLQKTPVAISAISADTLDKQRVMTVADITTLVPGFSATTQGDHGVITLSMRGIGNDSAKTEYADPEVALFVDGVYTPRAEAAAGLLLDLESAEVLRGPQGTLWGRNSTVGAVNFQTAKPELGNLYGYAKLEFGNYAHIGARAAINVPVSETFAFRVALAQEQHDGYVDFQSPDGQLPSLEAQQAAYLASGGTLATFKPIDVGLFVTRGEKYNAQDQSAARISSLWTPNENFTWNLSFEYFRDRGTPNANLMQQPRAGQEFWSSLVDTAPYLDRNAYALRSRMDYVVNDGVMLSYIAGASKFDGRSDYDQDSGVLVPTSFATGATYQNDRTNYSNYESQSHELNLRSTGENAVDWIVGLYYAGEDNKIRFDIPLFNGTSQGTVAWQGSFIQPKQTVDSYAGFGQATWHLSDAWRLTAGARYTRDRKENIGGRGWGWAYNPDVPQIPITPGVQPGPENGFGLGAAGINDGRYSANKPTWLLRFDGDLSEKAFVYASVSTGYKSGGLQDGGVPYKGETLTNYEVGAKFTFLDRRLTWNNALYYEDFKNFQLAAPITFVDGSRGLGFSNVQGSTKVSGFESELTANLGDADRVSLVFSTLFQKKLGTLRYAGSNDYGGLPPCPPESGIGNCLDVSGNDLAHAPDVSLTLVYEHLFRLSGGGTLTPRISAHYESESWLSPFNLGDGDKQDAYARGDFSLRYSPAEARWWCGLYVNNVSDEKVRTNAGRTAIGNGAFLYVSQYQAPRTFGVNFGVDF